VPPSRGFRSCIRRSTSDPDRPSCSAGCKTATAAIPSALDRRARDRRSGNVVCSSESHVSDFVFFAVDLGAALSAVPLLPLVSLLPLLSLLLELLSLALVSDLAALLYDSER